MIELKEKVSKIYNVLEDKKAFDIKILYIGDLTTIADYFIIATGNSDTHVKALTDEVEKKTLGRRNFLFITLRVMQQANGF